jgi:AraC-like DNA-binding protein
VQRNSPTVALTTIKAHLTALKAFLSASERLAELTSIERLIEQQIQARPAMTRVPVSDVARNLDLVAQWLNEPFLGLRLAPYSSRHHPHLSFFFHTSGFPLPDYLLILERYIRICTQVMTLSLEETPDHLILTFTPDDDIPISVHQHEGFAASVADAVYRCFSLRPDKVSFRHQRALQCDEEYEHYRAVFGCEPFFRQSDTQLIFSRPRSFRRAFSDPDSHIRSLQQFEALNHKAFPDESWSGRCRFLLRLLMYCGEPQKQTLADILTVTPRTLQRRLSDEGTTFRALLNQLRMDMTEQYLQEGKLSHEEITFLLGFRDRGVFYRAFRQWFGTSPGEYQQAL